MKIAFLHTVRSNIALFQPYIDDLLPTSNIQISHFLEESLLDQAIESTPSQAVNNSPNITCAQSIESVVHAYIKNIARQGFDLIVCTCSSIGEYAETTSGLSAKVVRIDRAMAEKAVRFRHLYILAAAESTVSPTYKLVCQSAEKTPLSVCEMIHVTIVPHAWQHYSNGDHSAYITSISKAIESTLENAPSNSVIILAQASMAPAATFSHPFIPILTSPIDGIQSLLRYIK